MFRGAPVSVRQRYAAVFCLFLFLGAAQAALAQVNVSVSSPYSGANVTSPFTLYATATGSTQVTGWYVYADNTPAWNTAGPTSSIAARISLSAGAHQLRVRAWQSNGAWGDYVLNVNVAQVASSSASSGTSSGLPTPPSNAKVWSNLEDSTSGWSDCGTTACAGGASGTDNYWTAPFQGSPSLDGSSREFYNGGSAWSNVLWIKKLGAQNSVSNFLWDFYVQFDSGAANNLWTAEYDLWQSVNGQEFMIGSQCNFGLGVWDVWNSSTNTWVRTSIPCKRFAPGTWHHIQWYVQRVSGNQYRYKTLVVDGAAHNLSQTFYANASGWADCLGLQWQLDLNGSGVDAHEWIDKVKLTAW
jgi:hypothetical protein